MWKGLCGALTTDTRHPLPLVLSSNKQTTTAVSRGYPTVLLRIVLVAAGMWLWFKTAAATGWDAAYNGEWTANVPHCSAARRNNITVAHCVLLSTGRAGERCHSGLRRQDTLMAR